MTTTKRKPARRKRTTPAPEHVLLLRTCDAQMRGHGGFHWPTSGKVACSDWDAESRCGGGLHGLLWGEGDADLLSKDAEARWLVVRVLATDVVKIGADKAKFPRGVVVFCGGREGAVLYLLANGARGRAVVFARVDDTGTATAGDAGTATAGDAGTATAGYAGTATAGDAGTATAGDAGTATAGTRGTATAGTRGTATAGDAGTATAGYAGTATAGDAGTATAGYTGTATAGYAGTATAGDAGTATAGTRGTATAGDAGTATAGTRGTATAGNAGTATAGTRGTATAGYAGTATAGDAGTATAGTRGTATAGDDGIIVLRWYDGKRYRLAVRYCGEDGVVAGARYRCTERGEIVRVGAPAVAPVAATQPAESAS